MATSRRRYEMTDQEWKQIEPYFMPKTNKTGGRPMNDLRNTINGIIWIARSGAPWRDLPERYGEWNTVYKAFARFEERGIFTKLFEVLSIDADMQDISIDSTSCKVHQDGTGAKKGL